ncbi:MAG: GDSL-type esterase/lipase family protein [Bacteroides sp.]|nr:GDSL-type esterase/lipase family protein [Bacteroides sp.]
MRKILLISLLLVIVFNVTAQIQSNKRYFNIVYIGNSITKGVQLPKPAHDAPPVQASLWLQKQTDIGAVEFSNQGVSGKTTVDFLPASETFFPKVKAAADLFKDDPQATLIFSIMLGTNDSAIKGPNGAPVSPKQYYTNLKTIIDELLALYPQAKIVIHRPIWYSPNTYNSSIYLKEGLERLNTYFEEIQALVNWYGEKLPDQVYVGDTEAYEYFQANYEKELIPENGNAGTFYLHPNKQGAAKLGEFWGKAIHALPIK